MKKIKVLCVIISVAILCVSMYIIFRNDDKKQVNLQADVNQTENNNWNEHNGDEKGLRKMI